MKGNPREADELPLLGCGAALVALIVALPIVTSICTPRGFTVMKFATGLPLACLAAIAGAWAWWSSRVSRSTRLWQDPVTIAAIGLFACVVVSTLQAEAWQQAMLGGYFRLEGALAWIAYLAAFSATRTWVRSGGSPRLLVDAMVLASIVPACYAVVQRFGLDFVTYSADPTRSSGTLGNPVFLGAYLAICIPLTLGRIGMTDMTMRSRAALWIICALQLGGLLATGSRGALLGLAAALVLLACARIHAHSGRKWLAGLGSVLLAVVALLACINLTDAGRAFARGVPVLSRLVYDPQGTDAASRSVHARLAGWKAAEAALAEASAWRFVTGFGPDVAHERYYAFVPVEKIRAEDFRREQVFDRVHADLLDTAAALGLAGVAAIVALFAAALHGIARRAFRCSARTALICLAAGALGAVLSWLAGAAAGAGAGRWPLAGAGWIAGWLAAVALVAWRRSGRGGAPVDDDHLLAAGIGAALLAFWVDAQVGLPVFVTRMGFFILLAIATAPTPAQVTRPGVTANRMLEQIAWIVACAAALLSLIPAFGAGRDAAHGAANFARAVPVIALLVLGAWFGRRGWREDGSAALTKLAALIGALALLAVLRYHVGIPATDQDWLLARTAADATLPFLIWLSPVVAVWRARRSVGLLDGRAVGLVLTSAFGLLATGLLVWRLMEASVLQAGYAEIDHRQAETRAKLISAALRATPWEWQYRYALVDQSVAMAATEVAGGLLTRESRARYGAYIDIAETTARAGVVEGSADPWRPFLIGLALQFRGQSALAPADPEGVASASAEADHWLGESHRLFPVHPLILEQWIRLKIDRGEVAAALRLIDQMDRLIPNEPEPYALRIEAGKRFSLSSQVERGLEEARARLKGEALRQVLSVAN